MRMPAGALHDGLEHDGGDLVGALGDRALERGEGARVGARRRAGERDVDAVEEDARERPAKDLDAAEARGADGLAVEGAVERDEASSLGCAPFCAELHARA